MERSLSHIALFAALIAVLEALPAAARRLVTRAALAALVRLRLGRHVRKGLAGGVARLFRPAREIAAWRRLLVTVRQP